jgi:hypothetical protein
MKETGMKQFDIISVNASVRVGFGGTKTHILSVDIKRDDRDGTVKIWTGQTHCGSQRWNSGWAMLPLGTAITCAKCAKHAGKPDREWSYGDSHGREHIGLVTEDAARFLTTETKGSGWRETVVPTQEAVSLIRAA